jgi:tyrosine-protein phosphatase YwqE
MPQRRQMGCPAGLPLLPHRPPLPPGRGAAGRSMIDIHSHLLWGVDDGSRSLAQSVGVLKELAGAGITDIVVTPHLRAGDIPTKGEAAIRLRDERLAELRAAAPAGVRLHAGFEIMLDRPLPPEALGDRRYALAGSRYYLVEFPLSVMGSLVADVLQEISGKGLVPMVAHPERYHLCTAQTVDLWRTVGGAIQVDATEITRPTSRGCSGRASRTCSPPTITATGAASPPAGDSSSSTAPPTRPRGSRWRIPGP